MHLVGYQLWAPDAAGEYTPAASLLDASTEYHREAVDVSILDPMKRNPERTRWSVFLALITLRRPPAKYVPDNERAGKREYVGGLQSITLRARIESIGDDGMQRLGDAMYGYQPLQLHMTLSDEGSEVEAGVIALVYITEFRHEPSEDGSVDWIEAQVSPLQEKERTP